MALSFKMFWLILLMLATVNTMELDYGIELDSRIAEAEGLLKQFKAFEKSIAANKSSLSNTLTSNNNSFAKTGNKVKNEGVKYATYVTNKKASVENHITKTWAGVQVLAQDKETTLSEYKKMKNLNITEAWWKNKIDKNFWRTKAFNNYIKLLTELLDVIKSYDLQGIVKCYLSKILFQKYLNPAARESNVIYL